MTKMLREQDERLARGPEARERNTEINHLIAPLMRVVAKFMHQELDALTEGIASANKELHEELRREFHQEIDQLRREVQWARKPKQRVKTKLSPKEIKRRADQYVANMLRAPK
jgi:ElaB/YqjD/DUF883 family membrane-anchored ribosome-binding protein